MKSVRNEFVELVKELHLTTGYHDPPVPSIQSRQRCDLWLRLLQEEVAEFSDALSREDVVAIADALGDCLYVVIGASLAFGIPIEEVFREIHRSNMTKDVLVETNDAAGQEEFKLQKGSRYIAPQLALLLGQRG